MQSYDNALIALRRIIRATDLYAKRLARETGLTTPQLLVLQSIAARRDTTVGAVASDMNLTQATVTTIIDRLERHGLVNRRRNQADKRKVNLLLTRAGSDLLEQAPAILQDRFVERFETLEDWEQSYIVAALQRVAQMMDASKIDASPLLYVAAVDQFDETAKQKK